MKGKGIVVGVVLIILAAMYASSTPQGDTTTVPAVRTIQSSGTSSEATRLSTEVTRLQAETSRLEAEMNRLTVETARVCVMSHLADEEEGLVREATRLFNETAGVAAETGVLYELASSLGLEGNLDAAIDQGQLATASQTRQNDLLSQGIDRLQEAATLCSR